MLTLFAQRNNADAAAGFAALGIGVICGCLLVVLVIAIFFLLTLQKALSRCSPRNRTMEPGMVWLNLVPLLNVVWMFITVTRISESLEREFRSRGMRRGGSYGYGVGMAYCVAYLIGIAVNFASKIVPMIGLLGIPMGWAS